jgi:hypothetical protein
MKFYIWEFFEICWENSSFVKIWQELREKQHIYIYIYAISRLLLLRMRNVSHKSYRGTHNIILFSINYLRKSCRLWDNVEKYCRAGQDTEDITCWIPKATNTLLDYVILIVFQCNNGCTNASHLCVIVHSLSCLFWKEFVFFINSLARSGMGWHEPWSGRRRLDS